MSQSQVDAANGGTTPASNGERRWAHRKPCGYAANIVRPGSGTNISCSIVNMSTTGACLNLRDLPPDTDSSPHLPAYFTLTIRTDRMEIDCAIVWRKGTELGVRFMSAPRQMRKAGGNC